MNHSGHTDATMATKRSWKLQEFVAHASNINCLAMGPKSGRLMVTGGDDKKVNLWGIGKPNCIMSLSGQTSPVESVRFNADEELLAAGSQSGTLKIWNLEAAKIVRTLTGHKSNVTGLDFHPYGDFVASSSSDTKVKLWDIRRKGCIYTYTGHTGPVDHIQFSPDGRWLLTGGEDCVIKLWDLAVGKLLHEFKGHKGPIKGIKFHPVEFLMASGSNDKTVKFWDLETFQMVSSTAAGANPVRSIGFHPDGEYLFCGSLDHLHVFGWEPVRCYDAFSMSWGKVQDMIVANTQLIGASFYQTNVSVYVADVNKINTSGNGVQYTSPEKGDMPAVNELPRASPGRRSFRRDRPYTTSTKQKLKSEPQRQSPTEDDERENLNSSAEIRDPAKYEEIFQPKHKLSQSPVKPCAPFPAPPEERVPSHGPPSPQKPPSAPKVAPTKPTLPEAPTPDKEDLPRRDVQPPRHEAPPTRTEAPPTRRDAMPPRRDDPPPRRDDPPPRREDIPKKDDPPPKREAQILPPITAPPQTMIPSDRNKPIGLDMNDFLPQKQQHAGNAPSRSRSDSSSKEKIEAIRKGHSSVCSLLQHRHRNLDVIRAIWTAGDLKTAVESAVNMRDQAVVVDILNTLNLKRSLWTLDLCVILLPSLKDLLTSKYENYIITSCASLKLLLKSFTGLINTNIKIQPSGVDLTREERYEKCSRCYTQLLAVRGIVEDRQSIMGKLGSTFRELQLLLNQLE